jgi:hypothetical protein
MSQIQRKIITPRTLRFAFVVTIAMLIWHATLIHSDVPHIQSIASWVTTILGSLLSIIALRVIYMMYRTALGMDSDLIPDVGGGLMFVEGEAIIALIIFIVLLPIILYALPVEVGLGIAYKYGWWKTIQQIWQGATLKEHMFLGVKAVTVALSASFLAWEILLQVWKLIRGSARWVWNGNK